jgi:ribosomal protein S18 acetylase RimI-like enzyme
VTVTQNNFTWREGSMDDKDQLMKLGLISYSQYTTILTPDNWAKLNGFFHDNDKWIDLLNRSKSYVCMDKDEIIGMAFIVPSGNPWDIFKTEWSYIRMVGVNPAYQEQGIAKTLTKMCLDYARQTKEKTIALHTSEFMDAARHVYESLGFKKIQEIEPRLGKRYWLYMLDLVN